MMLKEKGQRNDYCMVCIYGLMEGRLLTHRESSRARCTGYISEPDKPHILPINGEFGEIIFLLPGTSSLIAVVVHP